MIKIRELKKNNYKAIWFEGKTIRIPLNAKKPITELEYPEFYDIKITNQCKGECPYCYQDSRKNEGHYPNIVQKFKDFFDPMTANQRPFQIAYGGGEPTSHPDFIELLKVTREYGIMPNYTTNGMNITPEILEATKKYCGGVAITTHRHLTTEWMNAINKYDQFGIKLNLHILISDRQSIEDLYYIFKHQSEFIDYFVLLPYTPIGRAKPIETDFDFLFVDLKCSYSEKQIKKIAFGANFYSYLKKPENWWLDVSLYEPESMSKYIDFKDMKVYPSSFIETGVVK